ncbi:MAG: hypothetical protein HYX96_02190 [Chloroflexi bacterium]|nr:hypothetical protein [Chloroflexota bacterium]
MSELGKIEKPEAGAFVAKRKLYVVTLIFPGKDMPPEYTATGHRPDSTSPASSPPSAR